MKPKGEIDVENGLLTYRGVPAIIVSRTTQGMLIREMYNLAGRGILMAFRRCGLEGGRGVYKYLLEFAEIDEENIFDNFYKLEEDVGWGKYSVPRKDEGGCIVRIKNSWFAEALKGEVDHPVCTYIEGYFEALFSEIYGQKVVVREKLCSAKGDPYCEFHIEKK